jgi:hypothetical protein
MACTGVPPRAPLLCPTALLMVRRGAQGGTPIQAHQNHGPACYHQRRNETSQPGPVFPTHASTGVPGPEPCISRRKRAPGFLPQRQSRSAVEPAGTIDLLDPARRDCRAWSKFLFEALQEPPSSARSGDSRERSKAFLSGCANRARLNLFVQSFFRVGFASTRPRAASTRLVFNQQR